MLETVRDTFPLELFSRLYDVLAFRQLSPEHILEFDRLEVDHALARLRERGYDVHVDDEAVRHLADLGYDPSRGARHGQRNIEWLLLEGLVPLAPGTYTVGVSDDSLGFRRS